VVILPIHYTYTGRYGNPGESDGPDFTRRSFEDGQGVAPLSSSKVPKPNPAYLWIYVVFTYVFTGLAIYLLVGRTNKIIQTRQQYLGSQVTLTDRTIRLSGIPPELRSEEEVKNLIEDLAIGKVDKATLCRDWRELDQLMEERKKILRSLEEAWIEYIGYKWKISDGQSLPLVRTNAVDSSADVSEESERSRLLTSEESARAHVSDYPRERPKLRVWYGLFKMRSKRIDAIDYYEERLRRLDEKIQATLLKEFPPTPLAFVTMKTIAECQMAVQAILDPWPMQLVASLAPAPADVVWRNTYLPRTVRMLRSWCITLVIGVLTVFWSSLLVPLAYLLNLETIEKVFPSLAEVLRRQPIAKSLVQTGLPTLALSLLTLVVPYLYDCTDFLLFSFPKSWKYLTAC
jgi:hypothetical protein